jgi:hypothetical protein
MCSPMEPQVQAAASHVGAEGGVQQAREKGGQARGAPARIREALHRAEAGHVAMKVMVLC